MYQSDRPIERVIAQSRVALKVLTYVGGSPDQVKLVSVVLEVDGMERSAQATSSTGPVDAMFRAMASVAQCPQVTLEKFQIDSRGPGSSSVAVARVRVRSGQNDYLGEGQDPDILTAAARAIVHALDQLIE